MIPGSCPIHGHRPSCAWVWVTTRRASIRAPREQDPRTAPPGRRGDAHHHHPHDSGGIGLPQTYGEPVALDFAEDGTLWIQSREPAQLYRVQPGGNFATFDRFGQSVFDTGHDLFHRPTGGGFACASCHPEGREDGFTFLFDGLPSVGTRRRTQALNVDLQGTAPFHWGGDLADMHELIEVVRGERMGGDPLSPDDMDALTRYVYPCGSPTTPKRSPGRPSSSWPAAVSATLAPS
jgi:hypothetical protein